MPKNLPHISYAISLRQKIPAYDDRNEIKVSRNKLIRRIDISSLTTLAQEDFSIFSLKKGLALFWPMLNYKNSN